MTNQYRILLFLTLGATGCGASDGSSSPAIIEEAKHSHYHVHAVDASHEHTHSGLDAFGGHEHTHQHPDDHEK